MGVGVCGEREGSKKVQTRLTALVQIRFNEVQGFKKVQTRLTALVQKRGSVGDREKE